MRKPSLFFTFARFSLVAYLSEVPLWNPAFVCRDAFESLVRLLVRTARALADAVEKATKSAAQGLFAAA